MTSAKLSQRHELRLGTLLTPIRMLVYVSEEEDKLLIEQRHFIKTAIQYLPYAVREFAGTNATASLQSLEQNIRAFYEQAVRRGYAPCESWLVPNNAFIGRL